MSTFTPSAEQAAIIDAPVDADVLVVAGAGSGKTFTMTQRIIALINRGVAPERILGLTFTRKAAGELLERVSAAVAGDMAGSTTATVSDRAFLKPAIFTYDAFFQTIVRQYGLLVGFDQNTQPLSAAGALQLATEVIDSHMDLAFSEDFGAFSSLANRVLALSDAIGSAMIGAGCTSFDDAINRVRQWDSAFINRLQQAVADEPMPEDEPKIPKIKRLKKDTDAAGKPSSMTVPNICTPAAPIIAVRCWRPHANAIFCSSWWRLCPSQAGTQYGRILRLHHCRVSAYRALPLHRRAYAPQVQPRAARRISGHLHHAGRSAGSTVPRGCVTEVRRQRGG